MAVTAASVSIGGGDSGVGVEGLDADEPQAFDVAEQPGPLRVAGSQGQHRRVQVAEPAGGLDGERCDSFVERILRVERRTRGRVVQDDRDPRHYAAACGLCAALPRRLSRALAFAWASGLAAPPSSGALVGVLVPAPRRSPQKIRALRRVQLGTGS
ncbi:hypothetical protein ACFRC1_11040 [Streptomyces sp. NPDC056626]|uniref:hypothetical protein n=1 Tax=Streptomyces sp. NPDC056626 TaxID=3345880 RepID=UPI0013015991